MIEMLKRTKAAARSLAKTSGQMRNYALEKIAQGLEKNAESILQANAADIERAKGTIGDVMIDRLRLTPARIADMAKGVREVAALPDPLDRTLETVERPNGLTIKKVAVPLGVAAIIYESRPNVTADAAALCIKSGNACGGTTEDEMAAWHHRLDGHEFGWTLGVGDGQGGLLLSRFSSVRLCAIP